MKMRLLSTFLLSLTLLCSPSITNAQFGGALNKAKNKAKNINNNSKVDKAMSNSNEPMNSDHLDVVQGFFSSLDMSNFLKGRKLNKPIESFKRSYGIDLTEAIKVIHHKDFSDPFYNEMIDIINNPDYSEKRYQLIDYTYKTELDRREMDPFYTSTAWGYETEGKNTRECYETLKFISDYIIKDNDDLKAEVAYAKKKADKIDTKVDAHLDAISINEMHKKNIYKVVFTSNKNINPATASESEYKTSFLPGEEIYGVAMVDKPLNADLVKMAAPNLHLRTNWNDYSETIIEHQMFPVKANQKYFVFPIVVNSSDLKCSDTESTVTTEAAMRWLGEKEDRRFKIIAWLKEGSDFHNSQRKLEGTFTFDASDTDSSILIKMANQVAAKCGRE